MVNLNRLVATSAIVLFSVSSAYAQVSAAEADRIRIRQQIATMETVLERAIVSGAENVMAQVRRVIPERPRLGPARASGFRLEKQVIFYVQVPEMFLPMMYHVIVRERQDRDVSMKIQQLQNEVMQLPAGAERYQRLEEILRLQQELAMGNFRPAEPRKGIASAASVRPSEPRSDPAQDVPSDVDDPESAYTREVKAALIDAMLNNSQALGVKSDESLTVVARDGVPANPQFPGDTIDSSTWVLTVKGSTLASFQARTISIEEARKLVEIQEQ